MNKKDCYFLGYTKKPHGTQGHILAFLDVDNPYEYEKINMFFLEMESGLVPFFIEKIQIRKKGEILLKLEDVQDDTAAARLRGREMYLPLNMLPKLEGNKFYYHEIIGFRVIDQTKGEIGIIKKVIEMPQNDLFSVQTEDEKEILVPINDDIIKKVERTAKEIHIDAPEGLIDLYLDDQ